MIAQNMPRRVRGFRTVRWSFSGDTLAPAGGAVHIDFHENDPADVGAFRAGFEWSQQLHPHFSQCDFSNAHPFLRFSLFPKGSEVAPRRKEVGLACSGRAQTDRGIPFRKPSGELFTKADLDFANFR